MPKTATQLRRGARPVSAEIRKSRALRFSAHWSCVRNSASCLPLGAILSDPYAARICQFSPTNANWELIWRGVMNNGADRVAAAARYRSSWLAVRRRRKRRSSRPWKLAVYRAVWARVKRHPGLKLSDSFLDPQLLCSTNPSSGSHRVKRTSPPCLGMWRWQVSDGGMTSPSCLSYPGNGERNDLCALEHTCAALLFPPSAEFDDEAAWHNDCGSVNRSRRSPRGGHPINRCGSPSCLPSRKSP